jgi:hypothetical protein
LRLNAQRSLLVTAASTPDHPPALEVTREEIHFRRIDMRGYRRSDGLYEVEGRVTDRKPFVYVRPGDGVAVDPNVPIHDMGVRLVFDDQMVVHEIETFTRSSPYRACPEGGRALQSLKGLRMTSGWTREVRARLRGAASCTHLMELLAPLATAAFQALGPFRPEMPEGDAPTVPPKKIDSCYAYAADGELVMRLWPQFSTRDDEQSA